jgi:hypothetical protein
VLPGSRGLRGALLGSGLHTRPGSAPNRVLRPRKHHPHARRDVSAVGVLSGAATVLFAIAWRVRPSLRPPRKLPRISVGLAVAHSACPTGCS